MANYDKYFAEQMKNGNANPSIRTLQRTCGNYGEKFKIEFV